MKRTLHIALLLLLLPASYSQDAPLFEDLTDRLIENGDETGPELVHEMLSDLLRHPLNLNTRSESDLNASGLFTPFQVYGILKYREKYGPFFSIYELTAIPGFTQEFLVDIAPLITLADGQEKTSRSPPRGMLLSNMAIRQPASQAYRSDSATAPLYPGSPMKITSRLKVDAGDRWSAGAAFEKDPGERWLSRNRPEHFTGYLAYGSDKLLSKMILGNFRIHRGMGLVHGLGFQTAEGSVVISGYRRSYAKPFASTMEYDFYRGIYAELSAGKWNADIFYSVKTEDVSLFRLEAPADLFKQVRKTGLHRTDSERNGVNLAQQQTAGLSVNRSGEQWYLGMALSGAAMELTKAGRDSVERIDPELFECSPRGALSFYGVAFGNRYELFGEAAMDHNASRALLAGGTCEVNPALLLNVSFRTYQPEYTGQTPKAYGAKTKPRNETGISFGMNIAPFSNARLYLVTDISGESNIPGYGSVPGYYIRNNMRFTYAFKDGPDLEVRFTGRSRQKNLPETGPGNGSYAPQQQNRYRMNGSWDLSEKLVLSGRIEFARLHSAGEKQTGKVIYSQVKVIPKKKIRLTYRYLAFNSDHWDNRIYTYEPGVRYSFLFPAWYGTGTRNLLVLSAKLSRWFTVRSKLGVTAYAHQRETGSGHDIRPGNRVWDGELQIQLDF
jgi:hypothetical protein